MGGPPWKPESKLETTCHVPVGEGPRLRPGVPPARVWSTSPVFTPRCQLFAGPRAVAHQEHCWALVLFPLKHGSEPNGVRLASAGESFCPAKSELMEPTRSPN